MCDLVVLNPTEVRSKWRWDSSLSFDDSSVSFNVTIFFMISPVLSMQQHGLVLGQPDTFVNSNNKRGESKEMICSVECDCGQFQFSCDDQPRNDKQQEMNMFSLSGWYSSSLWGFNVTIRVVQRVAGEAHSTNGDGKSFVVVFFFVEKKSKHKTMKFKTIGENA